MSPSRAVYGAAGGGWLVAPRNQLGYPSRRRRAGLVRQWRQEAALPAPTGRSSPSSAPWGLEMPRSQGACCQGPLRERLHRAVRVPSGERRFEGRCQGPPRGATAPDRQGPYGERRLKRKGYCQGPFRERRCPTVRVPSGERRFEGRCQGPLGERRRPTVRVPTGSDGTQPRQRACAAAVATSNGLAGNGWMTNGNNPWHGCLGRERRSDEQSLPLPV